MNIFVVHPDPVESAKQLCDKHICKMILESIQMLCTAWPEEEAPKTCGASHVNHPCSRWARESSGNYDWLVKHWTETRGLSSEDAKRMVFHEYKKYKGHLGEESQQEVLFNYILKHRRLREALDYDKKEGPEII